MVLLDARKDFVQFVCALCATCVQTLWQMTRSKAQWVVVFLLRAHNKTKTTISTPITSTNRMHERNGMTGNNNSCDKTFPKLQNPTNPQSQPSTTLSLYAPIRCYSRSQAWCNPRRWLLAAAMPRRTQAITKGPNSSVGIA